MILKRLGNKSKIAQAIIKHFPPHETYIEPFFGAGGIFFNKPKVQYNILNDIDQEVFNFFMVVKNDRAAFEDAFYKMPISEALFKHWRHERETEPINQALRFVMLSNFGYMGKPQTLRIGQNNSKNSMLQHLQQVYDLMWDAQFTNCCFRDVIKKIAFEHKGRRAKSLIYADPPYLGTSSNYSDDFTETDALDLFDTLQNSNILFALSEENHPFIIDQAKKRKLNIEIIGERQSLKKRSVEILITNYKISQQSLFSE